MSRDTQHADTELAASENSLLQKFYYQLRLIQEIEQGIVAAELARLSGRPAAATRSVNGSLVCDIGVLNALDFTKDRVFTSRRAHIHCLIHHDDVDAYVSRILHAPEMAPRGHDGCGRRTRYAGATEHEQHNIADAINAALLSRLARSGAASVVMLNDESIAVQQLDHFFNVAELWSLPLLFVLSGAAGPAAGAQEAGDPLLPIPKAKDRPTLPTFSIEANDMLKVYAFAAAATAFVRSACRPFLLRFLTASPAEIDRPTSGAPQATGGGDGYVLQQIGQKLSRNEREQIEKVVAKRVEKALQAVRRAQAPIVEV